MDVITHMHLGITPWQINSDIDSEHLCQQAELAETWGYDSFFLPESHFAGSTALPEPMMLLSAIAARTQHIKLGTTSYLLPIRHALLAAEQVATMDQLSRGRLILGLGRGYQATMLEAFGVNLREKRARFEDILSAMQAAWRGDYIGDPEKRLQLAPRPLQQPHPPLWVAGFGSKAIKQIGSLGLPYLASPIETLQELENNHAKLYEAMALAGHAKPPAVIAMRTILISSDAKLCSRINDRLRDTPRPPNMGPVSTAADWAIVGSSDYVSDQLARYRERLGLTHLIAVRPRVSGIEESANRQSLEALRKICR